MATTGELLVEYSTLDTGTALEHFLNISTGDGTGVLEVVLQEPDTVIVSEIEPIDVELQGLDTVIVSEIEPIDVELGSSDIEVTLE